MKKIFLFLNESKIFKKIFFLFTLLSIFFLCFSIPSFGSRVGLNYIVYIPVLTLGILDTCYLFTSFRKEQYFNKVFLVPFFFLVISFVGTVIYSKQYRSWLSLVLLTFSIFVLYVSFIIISNEEIILYTYILGLFAFSVYFVIIYRNELIHFKTLIDGNVRLGSYFDNENGVSSYAGVGFIITLYTFLFSKIKIKWLLVIPIFLFSIVGVSTGSRTFVVAVIFITVVVTFFKYRRHLVLYFIILGVLTGLIILLFQLPIFDIVKNRIIRAFLTFFTETTRADTSVIERSVWLDYGFFLGNKHILTGVGSNGFSILSGVGTYTHSNFSEVWCNFGLFGFVSFYAPMIICSVICLKKNNTNISLVLSLLLYYLLISFSNVFYYNKFYYFNLALIFFLSFTTINHHNNNKDYDICKGIVFTCDGMETGGAEKVIASLSNGFAYRGLDVTIIGVSTTEVKSFYELDTKVKYITLHDGKNKKINFFNRVRLLRKTIKLLKPAIVISFLPHVNVYTYYAMLGMRIPVIVSERNNPKVNPKGFLLRSLKKHSFYQADGVVFQTKESAYYYKKSIRNKSTIIYNPVDQRLLCIRAGKNKNNVVLSVGRLTEQKNHKLLIDAFTLFLSNHPNYVLRIYGEGHLHDELLKYADEKGVSNSFEILPPNCNWHDKEKDDALFVLSSNYEGMPNALLEAMVIGIPCISTNCPSGGPFEIIKSGENGYLVNVGDAIDMANKMALLVDKVLSFDLEEYSKSFRQIKICDDWLNYIKLVIIRKASE